MSPSPARPVRLILVRHGESPWNAERRLQGWSDTPLSDVGREQAERVAARLASEHLDLIVSSPLTRAMETAWAIARRQSRPVAVVEAPALKEMNCGDWEGLSVKELTAQYEDAWRLWQQSPHLTRMPNGEGIHDVYRRGSSYLESLAAANPGTTMCAVTHGLMIMALVCRYLGWDLSQLWRTPRHQNTAITVIRFTEAGPVVDLAGDASHLDGWIADRSLAARS